MGKDGMERARRIAAEAQARVDARAESSAEKQLFLPGMDDLMRAMPNHVARSSLFAPIARGKRKFHRQEPMVTRGDVVMSYTGEQLDEADADLALQLIHEARPFPLGKPVTLNRAALLRSMGRSTGKNDYEWLHRRIKAMTEATVFIEAKKPDGSTKYRIGRTEAFHIVQGFKYDDEAETYSFTLDPRWAVLFGNREFALLDWEKRLQIGRGLDLAKAMQRQLATSADQTQRFALDVLKERMQYASPMRKFREAISSAMNELERLEVVAGWRLETSTKRREQLVVWLRCGASG